MNEWINVEEKLPESSGRYLVYHKKGNHSHNCLAFNYPYPCCEPNIAYYKKYCEGWQWNSRTEDKCMPTHWMPLPDKPDK